MQGGQEQLVDPGTYTRKTRDDYLVIAPDSVSFPPNHIKCQPADLATLSSHSPNYMANTFKISKDKGFVRAVSSISGYHLPKKHHWEISFSLGWREYDLTSKYTHLPLLHFEK